AIRIPALIAIDCDGHRSGVKPGDAVPLIAIGCALERGAELRGVLAHAGGSYDAADRTALRHCAEAERRSVVAASALLREAGFACPVVSVGSTPTAHAAVSLDGVTEVRAGVFAFFDLVQAGIGVCEIEDIALSVLTTVIGHQHDRGRIIVDAGWMAMSSDRRTATQAIDQGYGLVCDRAGTPYRDLVLASASQEHGIIEVRTGSGAMLPEFAIGDRLRILPNHACATAAQHDRYHVVRGASAAVAAEWPRFGGW
ncbi:MAG: alanine racemase, partial [Sphingomonas sp.]